ncbi:MAG TPA: NAD(P)-binding domain-containing protein [Polyangiaceae bacterium]
MRTLDTVIIGAGQAGLAMSRCLTERGISHVVLERGRVAQAWRDRWDSLRLLTPNWQTRLPHFSYRGPSRDGFLHRSEIIDFFEQYRASFAAPVCEGAEVASVSADAQSGFWVHTSVGAFAARHVVIATGHCMHPSLPAWASQLDPRLVQVTTSDYKSPAGLPPGGVLVVGASATGVQLSHELQLAGHAVTLAVGRHCRMPRSYRGRDIMEWLDSTGILHERLDQVRDIRASRRAPSLQLVGSDDHRNLDLGTLQDLGVRLCGRALGGSGSRIECDRDLGRAVSASEAKLARVLQRIDDHIAAAGLGSSVEPSRRLPRVRVPAGDAALDLAALGIRSVLWATGYRRSYPWLKLPILTSDGEIAHANGVTPFPGAYVLGLNFQRRRSSSYIDGVGDDARQLSELIARRLGQQRTAAPAQV